MRKVVTMMIAMYKLKKNYLYFICLKRCHIDGFVQNLKFAVISNN